MTKYKLNDDICLFGLKNFKVEEQDNFVYPNIIDYRDFCLPTDNQHNTPHCVGYTVGGYLEVNYWKRYHIPKQFNAEIIYKSGRRFKPDTMDGTRIEYCLQQLKKDKVISGSILSFKPETSNQLKYIIHQYGIMMCALKITDEWYKLDSEYRIKEKKNPKILGGHCVLCCGYSLKGVYIQNSWGFEKWGNYGFAIVPWNMWVKQIDNCVFIKNLKFNLTETEKILNDRKC